MSSSSSSSSTSSSSLSSRLSSTSLSSAFSDISLAYSALAAVPSPSVSPPPHSHSSPNQYDHHHLRKRSGEGLESPLHIHTEHHQQPRKPSKTNAFFASPFSNSISSSTLIASPFSTDNDALAQPSPKRSITASFFATKDHHALPPTIIVPPLPSIITTTPSSITASAASSPTSMSENSSTTSSPITHSFFSAPLRIPSPSSSSSSAKSTHSLDDKPMISPPPAAAASRTNSFFSSSSSRLSPHPPSLQPSTSTTTNHQPHHTLPKSKTRTFTLPQQIPLSRLFPSRYTSSGGGSSKRGWRDEDDHDEGSRSRGFDQELEVDGFDEHGMKFPSPYETAHYLHHHHRPLDSGRQHHRLPSPNLTSLDVDIHNMEVEAENEEGENSLPNPYSPTYLHPPSTSLHHLNPHHHHPILSSHPHTHASVDTHTDHRAHTPHSNSHSTCPSSPLSRQLSFTSNLGENGHEDNLNDARGDGEEEEGGDTELEQTPRPEHLRNPLEGTVGRKWEGVELNMEEEEEQEGDEVLSPGTIIRSPEPTLKRPSHPHSHERPHAHGGDQHHTTPKPPPSITLKLVKPLGQGAFSAVWLAKDESGSLSLLGEEGSSNSVGVTRKVSLRRGGGGGGSLKRVKKNKGLKRVGSGRVRDSVGVRRSGNGVGRYVGDGEGEGREVGEWIPLSRYSSLRSEGGRDMIILNRSDSNKSTRSIASSIDSINSNHSITSQGSGTSDGSCTSLEVDASHVAGGGGGGHVGSGRVEGGVMRVELGKGGVCGVRPMSSMPMWDPHTRPRHHHPSDTDDGNERGGGGGSVGLGIDLESQSGSRLGLGGRGHTSGVPARSLVRGDMKDVNANANGEAEESRLVAVKMTPLPKRGGGKEEREERERMSVSFVREVEVLKHISHPNITPLLAHLTTSTHHVLVLPYLPGGDLLGLVNSAEAHAVLTESVLRQVFYELCKAVAWMHSVGLVHRDIKLENILLTTSAFSAHTASQDAEIPNFSTLPTPLIQLTDFGLSRFIDPANPLLTTRCGSEAYAAPELVMSGGRGSVASKPLPLPSSSPSSSSTTTTSSMTKSPPSRDESGYDARETDAWACGVVLYALVCRKLPFGDPVNGFAGIGGGEGILGEHAKTAGVGGGKAERRSWLMRIARGEYMWPEHNSVGHAHAHAASQRGSDDMRQLMGQWLAKSDGARKVVGKLLVRDPSKRAKISEVLELLEEGDGWFIEGDEEDLQPETESRTRDAGAEHAQEVEVVDGEMYETAGEEEEEEEEEGCLINQPPKDSIVCREVV